MAFHDADTQAAAQSALGRALATFHTPNDDPSVNVLAQCPSAIFELLWPIDVNDPDNLQADALHQPALAVDGARGLRLRHVPDRGLPISRNQPQPRSGDPLRAIRMEGTLLGPGALPLPDGPLLRHVVVATGIRERQPPRPSGNQALGLRSSVPVRLAGAIAHHRRQVVYLLNTLWKP